MPRAFQAWAPRVVPQNRSSPVRAPEARASVVRAGTSRRLDPRYLIIAIGPARPLTARLLAARLLAAGPPARRRSPAAEAAEPPVRIPGMGGEVGRGLGHGPVEGPQTRPHS